MHIGQKVRLIHTQEEGRVIKILAGNQLEVELEDGLSFPVLMNELTAIDPLEQKYFEGRKTDHLTAQEPEIKQEIIKSKSTFEGIYAFIKKDHNQVNIYNFSPNSVHIVVHKSENKQEASLDYLAITAGAHSTLPKTTFNPNTELILDMIFFGEQLHQPAPPLRQVISHQSKHLRNIVEFEPAGTKGYLIPLTTTAKTIQPTLDSNQIKEEMFSPAQATTSLNTKPAPAPIVDLHIENLSSNNEQLDAAEMLDIQVRAFEQKLDEAIAAGMDEITFIHGVGNGTLKYEIQKRASQLDNIQYFKDTQKEKFGYGATLIKIK